MQLNVKSKGVDMIEVIVSSLINNVVNSQGVLVIGKDKVVEVRNIVRTWEDLNVIRDTMEAIENLDKVHFILKANSQHYI